MKTQFINQKFFALMLAAAIMLSSVAAKPAVAQSPEPMRTETEMVAPANDDFADAQEITGPSGDISMSNSGASKEAGEPAHALNRGGRSIWFKYVATGNGVLKVRTDNSDNIDTLLAVYVGNAVNNLTMVADCDNYEFAGSGGIGGILFLGTQTGTTYYIAVDGKNVGSGGDTGTVRLQYELNNVMPADNFAQSYGLSLPIHNATITTTNVGASKEVGEPNHAGNAGGRSVWFKATNHRPFARTIAFTIDSQKVSNPALPLNTLFSVYTGSSLAGLTPVTGGQFLGHSRFVFQALANTTYYFALDGFDGGQGADLGNFYITYGVAKSGKVADFDRDGIADLTVFRPSDGVWYTLDSVAQSVRVMQFGANGDKPMLGDYDRDGKVDYSVYRPDLGVWYMNKTSTGFQGLSWGAATDIPLARAVYSGGSTGYYQTVFRPASGIWYINRPAGTYAVQFGQNGDIPISADFTGDGTDEYCVFRPSNSTWYILDTAGNYFDVVPFGTAGDKPVPADYDADGRTDIAVFRPSNGTWYIIYSSDKSFHAVQWGQSGDIPQPADYEGDGIIDLTVYRGGTWYVKNSAIIGTRVVQFGLGTDKPMASPVP